MTAIQEVVSPTYEVTNDQIIQKYLNRYKHSKRSVETRKYNLQYFFEKRYFGYEGHTFDIKKRDAIDYFDYLNHLEEVCLRTKINKWNTFRSFLQFVMEYYEDLVIVIPKFCVNWKPVHKIPKSNRDLVMNRDEVKKILDYCKNYRYVYYIVFRLFAECGMRMSELRSIDIEDVNVDKRFVRVRGKTGRKIHYFSRGLAKHLTLYLQERKMRPCDCRALFISCRKTRYAERSINRYLSTVAKRVGVTPEISSHTFRRTLNTLRKKMGCRNEDRRILLCHKVSDVNYQCYVKLNYEDYIQLYDKWNPYKNLLDSQP